MAAISERSTASLGLILAIATLVVGLLAGAVAYVISGAREAGSIGAKIDALASSLSEVKADVTALRTEFLALKFERGK